jgi:hypothetical protein
MKVFQFKLQFKIHFDGPEGKKPIGRSRQRLEDNIIIDIKRGK